MFYEPVQSQRFFERDRKYADINWSYFPGVVDAFERRIRGWYIEPVEVLLERGVDPHSRHLVRCLSNRRDGGHYSFTVMAITCLLIDTLSQFVRGILQSTGNDFKAFVRDYLPSYDIPLKTPIDGYRPSISSGAKPRHEQLTNIADVLYTGFRCGILHQAHAPLYCGIVPGNSPPTVEATDHAKYAGSAKYSTSGDFCPVVVICPEHLFDEVIRFFSEYLKNLKVKHASREPLRNNFKRKFTDSFGIDISAATF